MVKFMMAALLLFAMPAQAQTDLPASTAVQNNYDMREYDITVHNAHAYATAPTAKTGAVFLTFKNKGEEDKILSVQTNVAGTTEIHQTVMQDDVMMMRPLDGLTIPAGGEVILEPTGNHIMLIDLVQGLQQGEIFDLVFTFEKAGEMAVPVTVTAPGKSLESQDEQHGEEIEKVPDETHHHHHHH